MVKLNPKFLWIWVRIQSRKRLKKRTVLYKQLQYCIMLYHDEFPSIIHNAYFAVPQITSSSSSSSSSFRPYNHCRSPVTKVQLSKLSRSNGTVVCLFTVVYTGTNNCCDVHQVSMTKKAAARAALVEKQHKGTNKETNKGKYWKKSLMLWPQTSMFYQPFKMWMIDWPGT